jgi:hypothetical protein
MRKWHLRDLKNNKELQQEIINKYVVEEKSINKISKEMDINTQIISIILKNSNIEIRGRKGIPYPKKIIYCSICKRTNNICHIDNIPYCGRHYNQIKLYGKVLERTKFDKNEIIEYNDFAEICLYNAHGVEISRAIIDIEDVEKVKNIKWHLTPQNYARSNNPKIGLHNFILGYKSDKKNVVDHINRNRLDCRKSNLRMTNYQENGINKGKQSNNTSGFPGVSYDNYHNKYEANIKINGKKKFLGYFVDINDAIQKRKEAESLYFGKEINREYDCNTIFKPKD